MLELYINDTPVELPDSSLEIGFEYAIMRVDDIGKRSGAKSYEFSLPKTSANLRAIGANDQITNISSLPYTRLKARAYEDGVDLSIRFCEITSITGTVNLRLYGANSDFYTAIKDVKLTDINLDDLNHFWDDYTILTRWLNTTGYVYPVIEYSVNKIKDNVEQQTEPIKTSRLFPSLFYEEILNRFFLHVGYTLENDMSGVYSDKMLLPYSGAEYVRNSDGSKYCIRVGRSFSYTTFDGYYVRWNTLQDETSYFKRSYHNWKADLGDNPNNSGTVIEFADRVRIKGFASITLQNVQSLPMRVRVTVFSKSGFNTFSPSEDAEFRYLDLGAAGSATDTLTATMRFNLVTEDEGFDFLGVAMEQVGGNTTFFNVRQESYLEIEECEVLKPREISYISTVEKNLYNNWIFVSDNATKAEFGVPGSIRNISTYNRNFITVNSIFGDLSFEDMLKDYCLLFNLIPIVNNQTGAVRLMKFDNVRKNISGAKDWTLKLDKTNAEEISFMEDKYARRNKLAWVIDQYKDEDLEFDIIEEPEGTNEVILVDNENLEFEKTIVELKSAATITCKKFDRTLSHIPVVGNNDEIGEKTQRILFQRVTLIQDFTGVDLRFENMSRNFNETTPSDYPNEIITRRYFSDTYFTDALLFTTLKPLYYPIIEKVIQNFKKLKVQVRLTGADINQLDFGAPVYLQQYESYFYISKIEDYKPSGRDSCMVELVKLNING